VLDVPDELPLPEVLEAPEEVPVLDVADTPLVVASVLIQSTTRWVS
jgi:hypothetical protein